jgi:hypothetical protein
MLLYFMQIKITLTDAEYFSKAYQYINILHSNLFISRDLTPEVRTVTVFGLLMAGNSNIQKWNVLPRQLFKKLCKLVTLY